MDELKNLLDADVFLGRGWNFPPQLTENGVKMVAYEEDIEQSLRVLFSTSPGERVNRYDYGCPLRRYTFEPIYTQTLVRMRADIARASSNHVSRWKRCRSKSVRIKDCC